ncbi:peptidase [Oceanibium sediminis]|uniref:peptidase n=1 Tax=Oceanibium sediminis TaxID=2026339 RepID=UPI000DD3A81E|nr:peptidase [Oceanibium sediminis]
MTYCVGLLLNEGMVFLSDTRTNAGVDNISTYRKLFVFAEPGEKLVVIQTAGSLSVTQTVIAKLREAIEQEDSNHPDNILAAPTMLGVAEIVGRVLSDVTADISAKVERMSQHATASMIVGGQRKGGAQRLFMLYPEGNFIEATEDTPYMQIGEHKYGKPILDRVVTPETSLEDARKAAILSMDSTLRSNLSVGLPLDLVITRADTCSIIEETRIEANDPTYQAMSEAWSEALRNSFKSIP